MPRVRLIQNGFSSGEFSPAMRGHPDVERYNSAIETGMNVFSLSTGGAKIREGLVFSGEEAAWFRLLPFVKDRTTAFVTMFGYDATRGAGLEGYVRLIYPDGAYVMDGATPYEVLHPYSIAEIKTLKFAHGSDGMYLACGTKPIYRLRRFADDNWSMAPAPFVAEPSTEQGFTAAPTIVLSVKTVGTGRTATASAAVFLASDVGRNISSDGGFAEITGYTSSTVVTVSITAEFDSVNVPTLWEMDQSPKTSATPSAYTPVGTACTVTLAADGWRAADVGKIISINSGKIEITGFTSATVIAGTILIELSSAAAAQSGGWSLDSSMWSATSGYPSCLTFHEQRLVVSGVKEFPGYVFGSVIGNSLDFLLGTNDSDAYAFKIAAANEIVHITSVRNLVAMAYNGEFVLKGGIESPISPTNIQVEHHSVYGSSGVIPARIGNELFFVQRSGVKLRAYSYKYAEDVFDAPDMSKLSAHRTAGGIMEITYQQEPYGRIFAIINDGTISVVTIDRVEGVVAWTQVVTNGKFFTTCTVPYLDKDVTFCGVDRTIDGGSKFCLEYFDDKFYSDSSIVAEDVTAFDTVTGLGHLEGEEVYVIADGVPQPNETVSGGEITISRLANTVVVGLPYDVYVKLLPVEFPTGQGSAQGAQTRTGEVTMRLLDTSGVTVEGNNVIAARRFGVGVLDSPADLFTGDKSVGLLGWQKTGGGITIAHNTPGPFHLLAVIRQVSVND